MITIPLQVSLFRRQPLDTPRGQVYLEGPVTAQDIGRLQADEGLNWFRPAWRQKEALAEIAAMDEGRVWIARHQSVIVGYVALHPPHSFERWGRDAIPGILELGAVEVSPRWRRSGVASALFVLVGQDPALEHYIVLATEYYWHWDLERTGLTRPEYRCMLEKLKGVSGVQPCPTDDPDIASHPSNVLLVRLGRHVSPALREQFARLLFEKERPPHEWQGLLPVGPQP